MATTTFDSHTKGVLRQLETEFLDHWFNTLAEIAKKARTTGDIEAFSLCFEVIWLNGMVESNWSLRYTENNNAAKAVDLGITHRDYRNLLLESLTSDIGIVRTSKGDLVYASKP